MNKRVLIELIIDSKDNNKYLEEKFDETLNEMMQSDKLDLDDAMVYKVTVEDKDE